MISRLAILAFLLLLAVDVFPQNHAPDTSFTTHSAFLKARKQYPFIAVAEWFESGQFDLKKNLKYHKVDGKKLYLDIFYPRDEKKLRPAVLLVFGGGWRSGERSQNSAMAAGFGAHGYVAFSADYRLSTEALYPAAVFDLKNAIKWIKANAGKFKVDTNRIAVVGTSAGGQLAALIGSTNNVPHFESKSRFKNSATVHAVINIDGVLAFNHPESGEVSKDPNKISAAAYWFGGNLDVKPEVWHDASPLSHAGKNTVPILFINSSLPRFHAGRDDMIKILNANNIYSEVHTLPDTPHTFWLFHPWFHTVMDHSINFLDRQFNK